MSAIIAIRDPETAQGAMAADSCMTGQFNCRARPKIRRLGPALVASSGSLCGSYFLAECGAAMEGAFDVDITLDGPWTFAKAWREWCEERGHTEQDQGLRAYPCHWVILTPHGLYEVCRDGGVLHHPPETTATAIGNGAMACMAAAHAIRNAATHVPAWRLLEWSRADGLTSAAIAERAIEAAIALCDGVEGPVQVCELDAAPS